MPQISGCFHIASENFNVLMFPFDAKVLANNYAYVYTVYVISACTVHTIQLQVARSEFKEHCSQNIKASIYNIKNTQEKHYIII